MSDNRILGMIRASRRRARLFNRLTAEQKRTFLASLEGNDWHLDDLLEDFVDICTRRR